MSKLAEAGQRRCFVTGGAGFIGSHLVERLLREGREVCVYDNLSKGDQAIARLLGHPELRFIHADLLDAARLEQEVAGWDVVFHLGANTDIRGGNERPRTDLEHCTIATFNLLEAMRKTGVRNLVFASSAAVYGDLTIDPTNEEAGPLLPISMYGAAKLACEGLIAAYAHLYSIRGLIFRFGNVVGDGMDHGVIWDFLQKLRQDWRELEILGDGRQERNFFLVEDCVDGLLYGWHQADVDPCEVYNLGTDSTTSATEVARIVAEEMGLAGLRFRFTGGVRGWPGDVPIVRYDTRRMQRLGWVPSCTSSEAARAAVRRLLGKDAVSGLGSRVSGATGLDPHPQTRDSGPETRD